MSDESRSGRHALHGIQRQDLGRPERQLASLHIDELALKLGSLILPCTGEWLNCKGLSSAARLFSTAFTTVFPLFVFVALLRQISIETKSKPNYLFIPDMSYSRAERCHM